MPADSADSFCDHARTEGAPALGITPPTLSAVETEMLSLVELLEIWSDPARIRQTKENGPIVRQAAGIHDLAAKVLSSQKLLGAYAALPTFWTLPTGFLTGSVARVDAQAEREMPGAATRPLFEEARRSAIAMSFGK